MVHSDIEGRAILVVDDEVVFARTMCEGLAAEIPGVAIHFAHNGEEALAILERSPIDLVVTDLKMPVMDGMELVAEMVSRGINLPVIMMTAFGTRAIELDARRQGVLSMIDKPIDFPMMVEICAGALGQRSRGSIQGVTLTGFLQLLEMECRTCTVRVFGASGCGIIALHDGRVRKCSTEHREGFDALCEIVSWELPRVELAPFAIVEDLGEPLSLQFALLEGARLRDEMAREGRPRDPLEGRPPPPTSSSSSARTRSPAAKEEPTDIRSTKEKKMTTIEQAITASMDIQGAIAVALVDYENGMSLGEKSTAGFPIELAAAGNTEVVRAKMRVMADLGITGRISDILITLDTQYHLIVPLKAGTLFLYLAIDRVRGNLGLARHHLTQIERDLEV